MNDSTGRLRLALSPSVALFKREFASFWVTPLAWVLLTTFLLLQGGVFASIILHYVQHGHEAYFGPIQAYFGQQSVLLPMSLLLLCPPLTMRSLAEERRQGTIELLLSSPASEFAIVFSKFCASLATYMLVWLPTLLYVLIAGQVTQVDFGAVATSYLGLFLLGASFLALGVFCSALSRNQLTALLLTAFLQFALFLAGLGDYLLDDGPLREFCSHLSVTALLEEVSRGLLDSRRIVLHLSLCAWALFVSTQLVASWRRK